MISRGDLLFLALAAAALIGMMGRRHRVTVQRYEATVNRLLQTFHNKADEARHLALDRGRHDFYQGYIAACKMGYAAIEGKDVPVPLLPKEDDAAAAAEAPSHLA